MYGCDKAIIMRSHQGGGGSVETIIIWSYKILKGNGEAVFMRPHDSSCGRVGASYEV